MARKCDPELRVRIIKEAEHLIHLRGYHCTSLDEIAARCKMTKANLFHHFGSKEDLGLAVLDYKMAAYRGGCFSALTDHGDPSAVVKELFASAACFFKGNGCKAGCFVGNIALEMSDINDRFREKVSEFFEELISSLEQSLRQAKSKGIFGPGLKPRAAAETVLALYEGAIMLARSRRDAGVFERVGREACAILEMHEQRRKAPLRRAYNVV